ncbi:MAG: methionine--tRNA ligase subunit beta [Rhizobacter sp.]|nr:methionine--tRNA ligase subunit beta [Chlorobiales bacterium]
MLFYPVIPETAQKIFRMIGVDAKSVRWDDASTFKLRAGHHLSGISDSAFGTLTAVLFKKIDDAEIEPELQKIDKMISDLEQAENTKQDKASEAVVTAQAIKPIIEFADFEKIDLRVGTVISCEPVPKADKLLNLKVRIGSEERQILSGIAAHYKPEELVGKNVIVVANLAPRKMRGLESAGMLLAIENAEGKLVIVEPQGDGLNGRAVK